VVGRACCGEISNSTGSAQLTCRRAGRERVGTTFCKYWSPIGRYRRAASGGCIAKGSETARWKDASDLPEGTNAAMAIAETKGQTARIGDRPGRGPTAGPRGSARQPRRQQDDTDVFSARSSSNTAWRGTCGRWIAACPPRRLSPKCAPASRQCNISWERGGQIAGGGRGANQSCVIRRRHLVILLAG